MMIVGEAPGEQEDLSGVPFVGPSGRLLDELLESVGLNRETDVYICNAVKCRPPGNRRPTLEEMKSCSGFLQMQIRLVAPKIIVALGRSADLALSATEPPPPSSWAGRWKRYMDVPVLVTYHPSYLLRNPPAKKIVRRHLKDAVRKLSALSS